MHADVDYVYVVEMRVSHDRDELLNEVYDREHIPAMLGVTGIAAIQRYREAIPSSPRYMALYHMSTSSVPGTGEYKVARDLGRWPTLVRPFTYDRRHSMFSRVTGDRTIIAPHVHLVRGMALQTATDSQKAFTQYARAMAAATGMLLSVSVYTSQDNAFPEVLVLHQVATPRRANALQGSSTSSELLRGIMEVLESRVYNHLKTAERD